MFLAQVRVAAMKNLVVFGFLGSKLDSTTHEDRWNFWRPTVSLGMHEELLLRRYELFYQPSEQTLCDGVVADLKSVSPETEVQAHTMSIADPWDFEEVYGLLHDFAISYPFDPDNEEYLVNITTGSHTEQICLFLLTESRHFPGKLLQSSPPRRKHRDDPAGCYKIIDLDLSKYDRLATRFALDRQGSTSFLKSGIKTRNTEFTRLIDRIERVVTAGASPVLLTGATGVGKSQLARQIFELKKRENMLVGRFVEINCATLRGDQSMSALFGHIKGSFTGATDARPGLLQAAHGGMLFLDEIGELGLDEQAMLLRAIEEKRFLPVGSDNDVCSDFQLIAGTNRNLQNEVRIGTFREDLFARINLWTFRLPGLAERREDIEPNVDYELEKFTAGTGHKISFSKEARTKFLNFAVDCRSPWKANFRDLNAAIIRMATLSHDGRITTEVVDEEIQRLQHLWSDGEHTDVSEILQTVLDSSRFELSETSGRAALNPEGLPGGASEKSNEYGITPEQLMRIDRFDRPQLREVIAVCRETPTLSEAGRILFDVSRMQKKSSNDAGRLRKYLARFGLSWEAIQAMTRDGAGSR